MNVERNAGIGVEQKQRVGNGHSKSLAKWVGDNPGSFELQSPKHYMDGKIRMVGVSAQTSWEREEHLKIFQKQERRKLELI